MDTQLGFENHLSVPDFRNKLSDAETKINGNVPLLVFSNHDNPRAINRFGDGVHDAAIARLLATLLLTPRDAALIYYGEEIGMVTTPPKRKEDVRDPVGKLGWPKNKGRDGERTPMQWNSSENAGFSTAKQTWLPVAPDYKTVNVAAEEQKASSLLNYYKALIRLRKQNPQLRTGDFVLVDTTNDNVLSYIRKTNDGQAVLVSLNFTPNPQTVDIDLAQEGIKGAHLKKLIASYAAPGQGISVQNISLPAYGSLVAQIEP
jgi:alpha-glucosidase